MLLHVQSRLDGRRAVVAATGEMDMSNPDLVRVEVMLAATSGCTDITLDLTQVSFIDAVSLRMLVGCHEMLVHLGGTLRVVTSNLTVLRILAITGLDQVFTVVDAAALGEPVA
jgi:anti-sigma B factor antagonist